MARFAACQDRQHDGLARRLRPDVARKRRLELGLQVRNHPRLVIGIHFTQRPGTVLVQREAFDRGGVVGIDAGGCRQMCLSLIWIEDVDHREGEIARVGCERAGTSLAGLLPCARLGGGRGKLAQQRQLPLADYTLRIVAVGAKNAADAAVVCWDRAIGEGVVGLLRIAVALHDEELRFHIGAFLAAHRLGQHGRDVVPDLAPDFLGRPAERPRMLAADDRLVGVIIEVDQLGPPPDPDRLAGSQHNADRGLETLRPSFRRTERRRRPVEFAQQYRELASSRRSGVQKCSLRLRPPGACF